MSDGSGSTEGRHDTADKLRFEMIRIQIEGLRIEQQGLRSKMDEQEKRIREELVDHEKRLRATEEVSTQFRLILTLTAGGGFLSIVNLIMFLVNH